MAPRSPTHRLAPAVKVAPNTSVALSPTVRLQDVARSEAKQPVAETKHTLPAGIKQPISAWTTSGDVAEAPSTPNSSLQARLALAAGMSKGFTSIASIAKPAMKSPRGIAGKLMSRSPFDVALADSLRARDDSQRAMSDGELNLNKMYARDHDGMVTARALLVGNNKALKKLMAATENLENHAAAARAKLLSDQAALQYANEASIELLTAYRLMERSTLLSEIKLMEEDSHFSLTQLLHKLRDTESRMEALAARLSAEIAQLQATLAATQQEYASYKAAAERSEARLSAEIARLCGVVEQLKADSERAAAEAAEMHAQVVGMMSAQLAEKQHTIEARDATIADLHTQLARTNATLTGQLRDLEKEKAERERRLEEEKAGAIQDGKRKQAELGARLSHLQAAKEEKERSLTEALEKTQTDSVKQADNLKNKIEKMRKLQELALGGVASEDGSVKPSGKSPSTRGRQLLYFESLKSKSKEQSSMSWRGNDVWAHEALGLEKGSPK